MACLDFEARKQAVREPMVEYISKKIALYHASDPRMGNRDCIYLRQHMLKGIYSSFLKGEVIHAAPADEQALTTALMTAVGQGQEAYKIGPGFVTSLDGLASMTINNQYETTRTQYDQVEDMEIGK